MEKKLLSMIEAMKYTGLTRKNLMSFIKKGELLYINTSQSSKYPRFKFNISTLDKFLIERQEAWGER